MDKLLQVENLNKDKILHKVSFEMKQGEMLAVMGPSGSGKSTLAKHINALLFPTEGALWLDGMNTTEEEDIWKIRQKAGMVFQNPDNQIIGTVVEEDVASALKIWESPRMISGRE